MFAAPDLLGEFVNAMEGWVTLKASIDRSSRSAVVTVEGRRSRVQSGRQGGGGGGPVLWTKLCKAGIALQIKRNWSARNPVEAVPAEEQTQPETGTESLRRGGRLCPSGGHPGGRTEKGPKRPRPRPERKAAARSRARPGHLRKTHQKRAPVPIGELELDMGMVVVEGDVFAVDHRS